MNRFSAMIRGRCPRCRNGKIFKGMIEMNERCPECGLLYERESGYFTGAMVFSYIFSITYYFGMYAILHRLTQQPLPAIIAISLLLYLPLIPFVFRLSRIGWIYLDRGIRPTD
jgi:uncharacterized protein (DUF983 family)